MQSSSTDAGKAKALLWQLLHALGNTPQLPAMVAGRQFNSRIPQFSRQLLVAPISARGVCYDLLFVAPVRLAGLQFHLSLSFLVFFPLSIRFSLRSRRKVRTTTVRQKNLPLFFRLRFFSMQNQQKGRKVGSDPKILILAFS